jgi:hypothetical protein
MLAGLLFLFDLAMFVDLVTKNPLAVITSMLMFAGGIFVGAAFYDPMNLVSRIGCGIVGAVLLGIAVLLIVKSVHWKREAKAAQMPDGSAT